MGTKGERHTNMRNCGRSLLGIVAVLMIAVTANAQDDSLKLLEITPAMKSVADVALSGCKPLGARLVGEVNKNNVYTLTGDFFGDGHLYAILDRDPILISKWTGKEW